MKKTVRALKIRCLVVMSPHQAVFHLPVISIAAIPPMLDGKISVAQTRITIHQRLRTTLLPCHRSSICSNSSRHLPKDPRPYPQWQKALLLPRHRNKDPRLDRSQVPHRCHPHKQRRNAIARTRCNSTNLQHDRWTLTKTMMTKVRMRNDLVRHPNAIATTVVHPTLPPERAMES